MHWFECIWFGKRTNLNKAVTNPRTISKFVHEISQYLLFRDATPPFYIYTPSIDSRISNNIINTILCSLQIDRYMLSFGYIREILTYNHQHGINSGYSTSLFCILINSKEIIRSKWIMACCLRFQTNYEHVFWYTLHDNYHIR